MARKPHNEYVIARTSRKRPTVQHILLTTDPHQTVCGLDLTRWPWRQYMPERLGPLLCLRCGHYKLNGLDA